MLEMEGSMRAGVGTQGRDFGELGRSPVLPEAVRYPHPNASAILVQSVVNHKDGTEQLCFSAL